MFARNTPQSRTHRTGKASAFRAGYDDTEKLTVFMLCDQARVVSIGVDDQKRTAKPVKPQMEF